MALVLAVAGAAIAIGGRLRRKSVVVLTLVLLPPRSGTGERELAVVKAVELDLKLFCIYFGHHHTVHICQSSYLEVHRLRMIPVAWLHWMDG